MMYRAQISSVEDKYHYKVRIPELNKAMTALGATPDSELYTATVSVQAGLTPSFSAGDSVFVEMETLLSGAPVILGLIYNSKSSKVNSGAHFKDLQVKTTAVFPTDTSIGEITSSNIGCLKGLTTNVQEKFNALDREDQKHTGKIETIEGDIKGLEETVDYHRVTLFGDDDKIKKGIVDRVIDLENDFKALDQVIDEMDKHKEDKTIHVTSNDKVTWSNKVGPRHNHYIGEILPNENELGALCLQHSIVLSNTSYGTELPDPSEVGLYEGQLFFLEYSPDGAG